MSSYRELLAQVKGEIEEVDARTANEELTGDAPPLLIDVRELDEFEQGAIPGAVHVPRGFLESRIENIARDRSTPIILSCQSGARSAFAAKSLQDLGYEHVRSLAGGFSRWKQNGYEWAEPKLLDAEKRRRYSRHLLIPEVGEEGQLKLLSSKVLMIGAGGLGCPPRSTWPPQAWARSASSTRTSSTTRTCSARCCTRPSASAWRRRSRRARRSRPSTRTSRSSSTASA